MQALQQRVPGPSLSHYDSDDEDHDKESHGDDNVDHDARDENDSTDL